jgi:hypothetical protein
MNMNFHDVNVSHCAQVLILTVNFNDRKRKNSLKKSSLIHM